MVREKSDPVVSLDEKPGDHWVAICTAQNSNNQSLKLFCWLIFRFENNQTKHPASYSAPKSVRFDAASMFLSYLPPEIPTAKPAAVSLIRTVGN